MDFAVLYFKFFYILPFKQDTSHKMQDGSMIIKKIICIRVLCTHMRGFNIKDFFMSHAFIYMFGSEAHK